MEGWMARAKYFEALWRVEKLTSAKLRATNRNLTHHIHGRSSEKLTEAQRVLFGLLGGDAPADLTEEGRALMKEARKAADDDSTERPKRKGGGRRKDRFKDLPEVVSLVQPPEVERAGLVWISEEITEQIEIEPANVYRHIIVRPVWADPKRKQPPSIAPLPAEAQVFPGSMYGVSFMVRSIIQKYADHVPLYRQQGINLRQKVDIPRQALNRIVENCAHLLITIAEQLRDKVLQSRYLHIDETVTQVFDPERRGRSRDAFLWGFLAPHDKAFYMKYTPKRSERTLFEFFPLKWAGDVQTDGGPWYASAFPDMPFIRHVECVGHLRHYVIKAMVANEREMTPILKAITELYRIERRANKRLKLSHEQRGHYRHLYVKPILKRMQKLFLKLKDSPRLEGDALEAVTYANNRWQHLAAYANVANGHLNIDQSPIERLFRPTKIGQNNWIAIGHPNAGWRAAVLYSIIGTCRLLNVNAEAYLLWVLPKLAVGTNKTTASGLLPHNFAALFPEQVLPERH
jgi:transposase